MNQRLKHLFHSKVIIRAFLESILKLNPKLLIKNPVLFVLGTASFIICLLIVFPVYFHTEDQITYNINVFFVLLFTILFANFAEALAEGRGRVHADSLIKTRKELKAKRLSNDGSITVVAGSELRIGDRVLVEMGDLIPGDGRIIEGIAAIDESSVNGESALVIREANSKNSSVIGGTFVASDWIQVEITVNPGHTFLDRMVQMVESATRQKSPNEIALTTLLAVLTLIFLIVVITLYPLAEFVGIHLEISSLVVLLVCLIPTTIGGLLSAIGISGIDRVTRINVLAKSGKAVETAGDINTVILDKTGTITFGNRMAAAFYPVKGVSPEQLVDAAVLASLFDETPEGRSIIELGKRHHNISDLKAYQGEVISFTAEERMSGLNLNGSFFRKGAVSAICSYITVRGGHIPEELGERSDYIARKGGTPLAVSKDNHILGIIYLKDTIKPGIRERLSYLHQMGIRTIMCTGDNPLTAATIAHEVGIDAYYAESKPEDKLQLVRAEQSEGKLVAMTGDGVNDAPALAQADVGIAMNSGTSVAKEAANMVDLDSDPMKILDVISIGKQLLITRGAVTTFSIANDFSKYFAILPAMFEASMPQLQIFNIMQLQSPTTAVLSALIFNAVIIPLLIPVALRGVTYKPMSANQLLSRNLAIYGVGGLILPFLGIKIIDTLLNILN
ncbi:potassium-transporting ATPase subunit KdpB [Paenibacillus qinlingensis]|uniref:Potassium-transporting ATPase ATP-binding subunit n=1 Tax=Paenibacillus qinlingensis TaxID=1837343 RepID=A0ABU1NU63_9BACL|nr:potassium-transporting ATPase subunit KdpB [Paenibacillus qinlingensis]MDR6551021.1 K+-transporting ATPase ATPase B chain [Paenibacillus qinlingensis]